MTVIQYGITVLRYCMTVLLVWYGMVNTGQTPKTRKSEGTLVKTEGAQVKTEGTQVKTEGTLINNFLLQCPKMMYRGSIDW
jgi:hypothetical protein